MEQYVMKSGFLLRSSKSPAILFRAIVVAELLILCQPAILSTAQEGNQKATERIRVVVVDENDKPIPEINVSLAAIDGSQFRDFAFTNDQGMTKFQKPTSITAKLSFQSEEWEIVSQLIVEPNPSQDIYKLKAVKRAVLPLLILDSTMHPVAGAIVISKFGNFDSRKIARHDGSCEIIHPVSPTAGFSIYHPKKKESIFYLFSQLSVLSKNQPITVELDVDRSSRLLFLDDENKPIPNFSPAIYQSVSINYPTIAEARTRLEAFLSDREGVLEINGLNPYARYQIQTDMRGEFQHRSLDILDLDDGDSIQEIIVSDHSIEENTEYTKSEFQTYPQEELIATNWLNSPALKIRDQQNKVVVLLAVSSLSNKNANSMNELQWMHEQYADKGLVAIAAYSSHLDADKIEKLVNERKWTMPICKSNSKYEFDQLLYLEPTPNEELGSIELLSNNALVRIRNRMLYGQKSYGRY
jgi:hypothetical protein